jgi:hypothetical protein
MQFPLAFHLAAENAFTDSSHFGNLPIIRRAYLYFRTVPHERVNR